MRAFEMAMTLLLVTSMLVASACGGTETGTSSGAEGSTPTGSSSASANGDATNNGEQSPRAADDVAHGGQEVSDASRTEGADVTVPAEDTSTPTPSPDTTTPSEADGSGHTVPEADGHTVPEPVEDVGSVDDVTTGPDPEPQAPGIPWNAGPYGSKIMDPSGDFTLPTLSGDWTLSTEWDGHSNYLFVFRYAASEYNTLVWNSDVKALLERAPEGTHLFFGSFDATWSNDITGMQSRVEQALGQMGVDAQASWSERVHYINTQANYVSGSLATFINAQQMFWFAIDRYQRWREIGSLYDWKNDNYPIEFMANESLFFDYEARIQNEMSDMQALEVTLWDNHTHPGGWGGGFSSSVTIDLPDAETLSAYDSMSIYLYTACPDHKQGKDAGCNEWDYIQNLYLCDVATPNPEASEATSCTPADEEAGVSADTMPCSCEAPDGTVVDAVHTCNAEGSAYGDCACGCGTEFTRWVTPYGREGNWLTDLSPLLPMVNKGGTRRFRFAGANGYTLHGKLLFYDSKSGLRPLSVRALWGKPGGESFNAEYNDGKHADVAFNMPDGATHVSLSAVISGHGHSSTSENCAEFCNHQHVFTVNGQDYMEEHPVAGTWYGCMEQTSDGGVPNQFGTWPFGRAGWCAGMDVKLWTVDLTDVVTPTNNLIHYEGLFQGQNYTPTVTDPGGYLPEIKMTSWLTFYGPASP